MERNNLVHLAFAALISLAAPVSADATSPILPTFDDLANLQAQEMYWDLRAKRDQRKAEAAKYNNDLTVDTMATGSTPQLMGIVGSASNLYATFAYDNGVQVEARAGDILPGGYKVAAITPDKARLLVKGKAIDIMRSTAGRQNQSQRDGGAYGMPAPMMLPGSPAPVH